MSSTEITKKFRKIITVTLNPTTDRVIEVAGLTAGDHQIGKTVLRSPGGKGVNVSRVLGAMGVSSTMTGFFGKDNLAIFSALASSHITPELVVVSGSTRENITIVDTEKNQDTHIRDIGLGVSAADIRQLRELLKNCCGTDVMVVFAGSIPPGVLPSDFANLVGLCADNGASVTVDTSGEALQAVQSVADKKLWLLKPNAAELQEIAGKKLTTLDEQLSAARKLTTNIDNVLLSLGANGACLITQSKTILARADLGDNPVRNTVGCGDVLLGAFIAGICSSANMEDALTIATATASASAAHQTTAMFDPELVEQLKQKTSVKN